MIKRKYKFDVKISKFNVANTSIALNEKVEKNAITRNRKFEQIEQTAITQNKKKAFFSSVNSNITSKKNSFRICRFIINTQVNFNFHFTRSIFNINILENIFHIYQQLFYVRFFDIFAQFALIEIIEKFDRNELNKLK